MKLSEMLLSDCEEFFDVIANADGDLKLDQAIDALRIFLERDADGWTDQSDEVVARAAQCRLMEIWGLISRQEKVENPDLKEYYDNLIYQLEDVSGYETDECEAEES